MKQARRINATLLQVLQAQPDTFSQADLLSAFRNADSTRDKRQSRQFVERNLKRLLDLGMVIKANQLSGRNAVYSYISGSTSKGTFHEALRQKLQFNRIELLTALGEAEAYDEICNELPELQSSLQQKYDEARDRSSKLLGRIRALENVIASEPGASL